MDITLADKSGVYRIVNTASDTTYIGSSVNIPARFHRHKRMLVTGKHTNAHLQCAWNKYGERSLVFEPLVSCNAEHLARREQEFIDAYVEHDMRLYNLMPSAKSRVGFFVSEETRLKMSKAKIGTANAKGHKWSLEMYEKMRLVRSKQVCSDETRAKMSTASNGNTYRNGCKLSPEHRSAISTFMKGRKHMLGKRLTPEQRAKFSMAMMGHAVSDEGRANMSKAAKLREASKRLMRGNNSQWV
jgi:group I intron endonuclease